MKRSLIPLLGLSFLLPAAPVLPLPETIVKVDGREIKSDRIRKAWENGLSSLPDDITVETAERLYTKLVNEALWQYEISAMLAEEGIVPDRQTAEKYLNLLLKDVPPEQAQSLKLANLHAPDAPDMKLKAALHFYLAKKAPQEIAVAPSELETFYRNNQMRFKQPGKVILGILETRDRQKAEMARAALLQGASFEAAVQLYASKTTPKTTAEMLQLAQTMSPGEVSPLRKRGDFWQIIQLRKRTPERFLSLQEASPRIRLELSARKEASVLSRLLRQRLQKRKIEYTPLRRQQDRKTGHQEK